MNVESNDMGRQLEQSRGSSFLNNAITFAILQNFRNCLVVKERFIKYDIGKNTTACIGKIAMRTG